MILNNTHVSLVNYEHLIPLDCETQPHHNPGTSSPDTDDDETPPSHVIVMEESQEYEENMRKCL